MSKDTKYLQLALHYIEKGDYFIAEKILSQLYKRHSEDASIASAYLWGLFHLRRLEDIITAFIRSNIKDALYNTVKTFCIILFNDGLYFEAVNMGCKIYGYSNQDREMQNIIGQSYYALRIFDLAERFLTSCVKVDSDKDIDKKAYFYLADIAHSVKKDSQAAYEYYLKAIGISDDIDRFVYNRLALQAFALGRYEEAVRFFELAGDNKSNHIEGYFTEGLAYIFLEDYKNADRCMKEVIKRWPEYSPAGGVIKHLNDPDRLKGFLLSRDGDTGQAEGLYWPLKESYEELKDSIFKHRELTWPVSNFYNDLDGLILYTLVKLLRPRHVIEFSPFRGYSTAFIYKALQRCGKTFTFETFDLVECAEFTELMRLLNINMKVNAGDALITVPQYIKDNDLVGKIGLCHIDSLHEYDFAKGYVEGIIPLLGSDCVIAIHDMYYGPDNIDIPFDHYNPISCTDICPNPASIGEAKAVREFFMNRDDYVLYSTHRLFGGLGHCAFPLPLNRALLSLINKGHRFLEENGYWTQAPMLLLAIPKGIYEELKQRLVSRC